MKFLAGLVLVCVFLPVGALAATRTAASCSRADVATAVNSAGDGDTIVIPAGTCTWTTNLTISNKILTLQGAGMDQTVIVDGVSKANVSERSSSTHLSDESWRRHAYHGHDISGRQRR